MKTLADARKRLVYEGWHKKPVQAEKEGVVIFNAPRPLIGKETWTGDFISGVFYAAVDTTDRTKVQQFVYGRGQQRHLYEYEIYIDQNIRLDAAVLTWFNDEDLKRYIKELANEYEMTVEEIYKWFDHDDLISSYIENDGKRS